MKNIRLLKSKKAMTLVELILGIALLSMISVLIVSIFVTASNTIGSGGLLKKSSENAAAGIENIMDYEQTDPETTPEPGDVYTVTTESNKNFTVNFSGNKQIVMTGQLATSTDKDNKSKYYYFIAD